MDRLDQTLVVNQKDEEPIARGNAVSVERNRLRVDVIKWLCSKIAPRQYDES
jgi:hypothetical protein